MFGAEPTGSGVNLRPTTLTAKGNEVALRGLLIFGMWRSGSAPASGAGGRWFESSHPDHTDLEGEVVEPLGVSPEISEFKSRRGSGESIWV